MTPAEALGILHQVTGQLPLVRADQNKVNEAFVVLNAAIQPKPAAPAPAPMKKAKG